MTPLFSLSSCGDYSKEVELYVDDRISSLQLAVKAFILRKTANANQGKHYWFTVTSMVKIKCNRLFKFFIYIFKFFHCLYKRRKISKCEEIEKKTLNSSSSCIFMLGHRVLFIFVDNFVLSHVFSLHRVSLILPHISIHLLYSLQTYLHLIIFSIFLKIFLTIFLIL